MSVVPQIGKCLELVVHCDMFQNFIGRSKTNSILMQNHLYAKCIQNIGFFIVHCTNCFGQKYYFVNAFATLSLQKVEAGLLRSFRKGAVLKQKRDSEPPFSRK